METNVKTKSSNEVLREILKVAGLLKDHPTEKEEITPKS